MRRWILPLLVTLVAACASAQTNTPTPTPTATPTLTPTPTRTPPFPQTTQITGLPSQATVVDTDEFVMDKNVSGVRRTRKVAASAVGDFIDGKQFDKVRVEDGEDAGTFTVMDDVDMDDGGDINFTRAAGPPDVVTATIRDEKVTEPKLDMANSPTDEYCLSYEGSSGEMEWQTCSAGFNLPGGNDTEVQYNDAGAFGGDPGLTYNETTNDLTLDGFAFTSDGAANRVLNSSNATGPRIESTAATGTNPVFIPDQTDPTTGIGHTAGVDLIDNGNRVMTATSALGVSILGGRLLAIADTDNSNVFTLVPPADFSSDRACTLANSARMFPLSCVEEPTLGTHTAGNYVATVADGTGIDGTATGEGSTYTPTFDATEISSATWGAGAFTAFTFDAGAVDPTLTAASGNLTFAASDTNVIINDAAGGDSYIDFNVDGTEQFLVGYGPDLATKVNWNGALWWDGVQTEACPDSGNGSAGTVTINPTKSYIWVGTFDADGCNITMGEPVGDMEHGFVIELVSNTSGTISLADSAGVTELTNGVTWTSTATFSGIKLRYVWTDADVGPGQWVEMSRSHPNTAIGGGDLVFANADGPAILNEAASCSNPVFIPDRGDFTTGFSGTGTTLCAVSGGTAVWSYSSSIINLLPDDDDGAGRAVFRDGADLWIGETTSNGGQYIKIVNPDSLASDRTVTLEDDSDPIPFSAVAGSCSDVAAGLGDETGSCGAVVLSTAPTISSPVLAGTPVVGDASGNDKLEFSEEASNPACSSGDYYIWANSANGKLKKCENGSISDLDNVGVGGSGGVEYDPDNYPLAGDVFTKDEFTSGATLTWTQQNADGQGVVYALGGVNLDASGVSDAWHGITAPLPADTNQDLLLVAKVHLQGLTTTTRGCGISLINGGTAAVPTEVNTVYARCTAATTCAFEHLDHDDYDFAGTTSIASDQFVGTTSDYFSAQAGKTVYIGLTWVDASEDIAGVFSWDGVKYEGLATDTTVDGYPVAIGLFARDDAACFFEWVRVIDTDFDAGGVTNAYKVGN